MQSNRDRELQLIALHFIYLAIIEFWPATATEWKHLTIATLTVRFVGFSIILRENYVAGFVDDEDESLWRD